MAGKNSEPRTAGRSAVITVGGQWTKYLVQIASLVVLTRLLSASDYGLVVMATAIIGLGNVIGDFGLSLAAVQARTLTPGQRSNLFWLNLAIGVVVGAATAASAWLIAAFYGDSRLITLVLVLSTTFVINGFIVQFRAESNRELRFAWLAFVDVLSQLAAFAAAVIAALVGFGYWALIVQQILLTLVAAVMLTAGGNWWPGWPRRKERMRQLVAYGSATFLVQLVNYASQNVSSILIGRQFGAATLGYFNRSFQLTALPVQQLAAPLTRVALPLLSHSPNDAHFSGAVKRLHTLLAYGLVGILSLLAAAAVPLVEIVLGSNWAPVAPIVQVLAVGAVFQSLAYVYYWIFLSRARTGLLFWSELGGRIVMIGAMFAVLPFGVLWVATASALGQIIIWLTSGTTVRQTGTASSPLFLISLRVLAVFGCATLVAFVLAMWLPSGSVWIDLLTALVGWLLGAAAAFLVWPAVRRDAQTIRLMATSLVRRSA